MKKNNFLVGIRFGNYTKSDVIMQLKEVISSNHKVILAAIDVMSLCRIVKTKWIKDYINSCDYILPDGYYVYAAAKFLKVNIIEQITAFDVAQAILDYSKKSNIKIFFLGSTDTQNSLLISNMKAMYGSNIVAGGRDGYFGEQEYDSIVNEINSSRAEVLFVGISSPQREKFLNATRNNINANIIFPVGGLFDIWSGRVSRAPKIFILLKLEWFYRFISEPHRMWRRVFYYYPKFIFMIIVAKILGEKND